jgi:hypothetical protein
MLKAIYHDTKRKAPISESLKIVESCMERIAQKHHSPTGEVRLDAFGERQQSERNGFEVHPLAILP